VRVFGVVTMQVFVRGYRTVIAAPVQCDVDGIPKGSHYVLLERANGWRLSGNPRSACLGVHRVARREWPLQARVRQAVLSWHIAQEVGSASQNTPS
jgi:hypothetical protein